MRYIFSIYDKEAERFMEPWFVQENEEEVACKVVIRTIGMQDYSKAIIPVTDLQLYMLGAVDPLGYLVGDEPVKICELSDIVKGEKSNVKDTETV